MGVRPLEQPVVTPPRLSTQLPYRELPTLRTGFRERQPRVEQRRLLILLAAIIAISLLIAAAAVIVNTRTREINALPANEYEIFIIEGMPCVRVNRIDGISCDWSKWHGR